MHTEKRHVSFSENSLSRKKLCRLQREGKKENCSILLNRLQNVTCIYEHTHTYVIFTPHTTCFHYWFLFLLPQAVLLIWNSGFQSVTQSSTRCSHSLITQDMTINAICHAHFLPFHSSIACSLSSNCAS